MRCAALGSAAVGLLACTPSAPPAPTASTAVPQDARPLGAQPAAPAGQAPTLSATAPATSSVETPRQGGELTFAVSAEPPSFDGHRETTFALIHPVAPHYSLLVKFDPERYPNVVGDLADRWQISPDRLTYTFTLRDGVKFHDGSAFSSRDVKASYERIVKPAEGILSARRQAYGAIDSVAAPDPRTVVFKLKQPSAAMLSMLASPWNFIYSAADLEKDPRFPEKNINGTGPFKFVEYQPGSHWLARRNEDYFDRGKPYLDGFRAIFIRDTAAQVAAIRGERAHLEFRGFSPQQRDDIVRALGERITVQESSWVSNVFVVINPSRPPFDDPRVRRALTLAVDRWEASRALAPISIAKDVGGLMRPGGPFSMPESELVKIAGFGRDGQAAKDRARALLREAGVPEGFSFTFKNRDIPQPYDAVGVFLIDQWRKIGLNVTQQVLETSAYFNDGRAGNFDVTVDSVADYLDEPDIQLSRFLSADRSSQNLAKYTDRTLDELFDRQTRDTDPEKRKQLVWDFERRVLEEQAYVVVGLWWQRIVPHSAQMKGWKVLPSHYLNQELASVWLSA